MKTKPLSATTKNKQKNEIQSAYFGHEAFTLYTAACYFKSHFPNAKYDPDFNVYVLSTVIVSNHERNITYSGNNKLIEHVRENLPTIDTVFFWSYGCSSQFRSRYVFLSLLSYPVDVKLSCVLAL